MAWPTVTSFFSHISCYYFKIYTLVDLLVVCQASSSLPSPISLPQFKWHLLQKAFPPLFSDPSPD